MLTKPKGPSPANLPKAAYCSALSLTARSSLPSSETPPPVLAPPLTPLSNCPLSTLWSRLSAPAQFFLLKAEAPKC